MTSNFKWDKWRSACAEARNGFFYFDAIVTSRRKRYDEDWDASELFESELLARDIAGEEISAEDQEEEDRLNRVATSVPEHELLEYGDDDPSFRLEALEMLEGAHRIHSRQMIVLAASIFEGTILNFLETLFENRSELMYKYLGHGELKGRVSLKLIARSESLEGLIETLAREAASRLYALPYHKMISELEQLCGQPYEPLGLRAEVLNILEARNRIVHDASEEPVSAEHAVNALNSAQGLNEHLLWVALLKGLPVSGGKDRDWRDIFDNEHTGNLPENA